MIKTYITYALFSFGIVFFLVINIIWFRSRRLINDRCQEWARNNDFTIKELLIPDYYDLLRCRHSGAQEFRIIQGFDRKGRKAEVWLVIGNPITGAATNNIEVAKYIDITNFDDIV